MSQPTGEQQRRPVLTGSTLVPLSLVATLLAQTLAGYIWLERRFTEVERQLLELRYQARDRWSGGDQRAWASELALRNRTLEVPPARHVEIGEAR